MLLTTDRNPPHVAAEHGSVVSIGVFDGVHLGHQKILERNTAEARRLGARATVVTFREHPKRVLLGRAPRTLTSLEHRLELFRRAGIEHAVALTFDEELKAIPAEAFVRDFLLGALGARKFVLGFDSKFGRDRAGTPEMLSALGYDVEVVSQVTVGGRAVSSTAIREAVELGDLAGAERMLGRPVTVYGQVVPGDRLGRQIGFPTANLDLHHELRPPNGVWAVRVRRVRYAPERIEEAARDGVLNIGFRPTVSGERPEAPRVEVHVLDFSGDLYGEYLEIEFVAALRDERKFPSLEALREQIRADVLAARRVLAP